MEGKSRAPMGSRKHGMSGNPGRSPRFKHNTLIEARKAETAKHKRPKAAHKSARDALKDFKPI
jgi:hypothetical protein